MPQLSVVGLVGVTQLRQRGQPVRRLSLRKHRLTVLAVEGEVAGSEEWGQDCPA